MTHEFDTPPGPRRFLPYVILVVTLGLFALGRVAASYMDFGFSAESVRSWVDSFGWYGPVIFMVLVCFRMFLFLPSGVVLSAGGLLFGAGLGTPLGGTGVLASALMMFMLGRGVGRDWLPKRFQKTIEIVDVRLRSMGPVVVGVITAHPLGPMWPTHWASGFSSFSLLAFMLCVGVGAYLRAFTYSLLGASLVAADWKLFGFAAALLVAVMLLPLAHRGLRERLLSFGRSFKV